MSVRIGDVDILGRWYRVMDAVVLAKEIYGFDTTQAKKFVDDLRGRPAAPTSDPGA